MRRSMEVWPRSAAVARAKGKMGEGTSWDDARGATLLCFGPELRVLGPFGALSALPKMAATRRQRISKM